MSSLPPLVRIVDDDPTVCESQSFFLRLAGWETKTYSNALDFLEQDDIERPGCLILDVRMPKMTGLELQEEMNRLGRKIPIIFLSAHGDIEMAVNCLQAGAFNFLVKPPVPEKLQEMVARAVDKDVQRHKEEKYVNELKRQYDTLTNSEKQVSLLIAKGLNTAKIAEILNITERTVQGHRSKIYAKLDLENPVEVSYFLREQGLLQ